MLTRATLWLALICALAGPVRSDEANVGAARKLFNTAMTEYNLGNFEGALSSFQDVYRLQPDPALLFNIGQCYRQLGRLDDALRTYRTFLRESPANPNRRVTEKMIAELERQIAARPAAHAEPTPAPPPTVAPAPKVELTAPPARNAEAPPPKRSRKWLWVTFGIVGGAAVAATAIGLGVALGRSSAPDTTLGAAGVTFR